MLRDVSFRVTESSVVGLIGPSGGGKSLLLKIIAGTAKPDSGSFCNQCGKTALMFQEGALFDSLNVFDNVAFPLVGGKVPTFLLTDRKQAEVHELVDEILARVGLSAAANKVPGQLSGGMRRRVSLARALVARPSLLLLDDPTSGLDPVASSIILDLIIELQREYKPTTLMVSHDLRRLLPRVDTVIALFDGEVKFQGTLDELEARPELGDVRHFIECRYDFCGNGAKSIHAPLHVGVDG